MPVAILLAAMLGLDFQANAAVVAAVHVHGNAITPTEEIVRLADVRVGAPFSDALPGQVEARLRAAARFRQVEVRKRFASISDPSLILLVILVDDGPVRIERTGDPDVPVRVVRSGGPRLLFLPVIEAEDGYGLTYGVRLALPDPAGAGGRLSFPLTWGGDKRAAVQFDRDLGAGRRTRVQAGAALSRRTNPFYREDDDRRGVWARGEHDFLPALRAGVTAGWHAVSFGGLDDRLTRAGADLVFDTRPDPLLSRNAVYARAAWERVGRAGTAAVHRAEFEARGYLGLFGQSILVVRALREDADRPLPPYLKPLLGGMANVRGTRAGTAAGDTLAAGSIELRVPLTSPLNVGKIGVSAFVDAGAASAAGERLRDQRLERGIGGAIWLSAAVIRLNVAVAHGFGRSTRAHVGTSVVF
jgi:outer membrane protein assembly factor BamA